MTEWQAGVMLSRRILRALVARGDLTDAGRCMARGYPGQLGWISFHDQAPQGISFCVHCTRAVYRGMGQWWLS